MLSKIHNKVFDLPGRPLISYHGTLTAKASGLPSETS